MIMKIGKRPTAEDTQMATDTTNPLLAPWTGPFGMAPFDKVTPEHFQPAFDRALAGHTAEIEAIAANSAEPTFANTIEAMEVAGRSTSSGACARFTPMPTASHRPLWSECRPDSIRMPLAFRPSSRRSFGHFSLTR